ncbi:MAG: hypothetical protein ACFFBU_08930, partial [Promethearchaeota archaeon]
MKKKTSLISIVFLLSVLILQPLLFPTFNMLGEPDITLTPDEKLQAPPVPQVTSDWVDVSIDVEYFYDDTTTIS